MSAGRSDSLKMALEAKMWDRVARSRGLRGEARYGFILSKLNQINSGDYRPLRRLIARADRIAA